MGAAAAASRVIEGWAGAGVDGTGELITGYAKTALPDENLVENGWKFLI